MFAQVAGVKNYFDRWAKRYDRDLSRYGYAVPKWLSGYVSGTRILDIGIGTGLCAQAYKGRHPHALISGVDASDKMLGICRAKGVANDLLQLDVSRKPLPYGDGSFDGVMCGGLLEFIEDIKLCVDETARVLRRGGRYVVAFEGAEGAGIYARRTKRLHHVVVRRMGLLPYPRFYSKYLHNLEHVEGVCEAAGLQLIDTQHFMAYKRSNGQEVGHWLLVFEKM